MTPATTTGVGKRRIRGVTAVMREEPALWHLAQAVILLAREQSGSAAPHVDTSLLQTPSDRRLVDPELDSDLAA